MIKKTLTIVLLSILLLSQAIYANAEDIAVDALESDQQGIGELEISEEEMESEEQSQHWIGIVTLTSGNLNVRKGPSTDHEIIGKLPNGSIIEIIEQYEEWVSIPHNGTIAYVSKPYVTIQEGSLPEKSGKVVVLDPGHGGRDPGAVAKDKTYESDLVWEYAVKAQEALENAGYTVYLTRTKDNSCTEYKKSHEDLACRLAFAKKVKGDIYISIHADSNPVKSFRGTVTFYNARNDLDGAQNPYPQESKKLAELVQGQVQPAIGSRNRGIDNRNFYVNRNAAMPSVLLELAVMSNESDLKLLKQEKRMNNVAAALTTAVDLYFQQTSLD